MTRPKDEGVAAGQVWRSKDRREDRYVLVDEVRPHFVHLRGGKDGTGRRSTVTRPLTRLYEPFDPKWALVWFDEETP